MKKYIENGFFFFFKFKLITSVFYQESKFQIESEKNVSLNEQMSKKTDP